MQLTMISNFINHHQIPFSNACYALLKEDYHFIQTEPMEEERLEMGWSAAGERLPYVHLLYEQEAVCERLIMDSDVLLVGWTKREDLIARRLQAGKATIRISERLYREGQWKMVSPRGLLQKYRDHTRYRKQPVCLLCAGAYVPSDFHLVHAYPGKMFRWGYFPETRSYTKEQWNSLKNTSGTVQIVWAGRFIPLKHPEYVIQLAEELRQAGYDFHIHMAGSGELEQSLKQAAVEKKVTDTITFHGFCTPEQVRSIMEKSHIHLFTSNRLEGWGAVVNEAMNSGCAEVVNVQVGAAPYLIRQGINGLVYPDNSYSEMVKAIRFLLDHPKERSNMGLAAYETIRQEWNAEHAAAELIRFAAGLLEGRIAPAKQGPLSPAPIIAPGKMLSYMKRREE